MLSKNVIRIETKAGADTMPKKKIRALGITTKLI